MRLTELSIKALKTPPEGQVTHTDDTLSGFGVRVSQGGLKSFVLVYGPGRKRVTIGRYPIISLKDARAKAAEILAEYTLGKRDNPSSKFGDAVDLFLTTHFPPNYPKPRTKLETARLLKRHFVPPFRREEVCDIQTHRISHIIDQLQATPSEARHAFAAIRQFFNWAVGRRYVNQNPCAGLRPPGKAIARQRVLDATEVKCVLETVRSEHTAFHNIVELLILTGQRRNEIASLRAEWVDFEARTITLPPEITKNRRTHVFPFGPAAEAVLRRGQKEGLLFPARCTDKATVVNGWSKLKPALDRLCPLAPWALHDLRRTCATNLAALGVPVHITEKLLNHISGTTGGIVAVYQRHAYLDEMREAIELWEDHLRSLFEERAQTRKSRSLSGQKKYPREDVPAVATAVQELPSVAA
jgi:integrase